MRSSTAAPVRRDLQPDMATGRQATRETCSSDRSSTRSRRRTCPCRGWQAVSLLDTPSHRRELPSSAAMPHRARHHSRFSGHPPARTHARALERTCTLYAHARWYTLAQIHTHTHTHTHCSTHSTRCTAAGPRRSSRTRAATTGGRRQGRPPCGRGVRSGEAAKESTADMLAQRTSAASTPLPRTAENTMPAAHRYVRLSGPPPEAHDAHARQPASTRPRARARLPASCPSPPPGPPRGPPAPLPSVPRPHRPYGAAV